MNVTSLETKDSLPFAFETLVAHLADAGFSVDERHHPKRCEGGLANLNYEIVIDGKPAILRRAPSGTLPKGAHDMSREHRVLSRLAGEFPLAPKSLYLCDDPVVIGAPFQIIEFRKGRVFRGDELSQLAPNEDMAASIVGLLTDAMAGLHSVNPKDCDLENLGRHWGFMTRNANRWANAAESFAAGRDYQNLANEAASRVRSKFENWTDGDVTILHCDIKLDNLIIAEDALVPVALLDWDMATLGDPMFDLATLLSYWTEPNDPIAIRRLKQMPTATEGFPTRSEMVAAYERATGRSLRGLDAARALCQLKLGVVFLQLHARWLEGGVGDDRYEAFEELGVDLIEFARDVALGRKN